jgi:hypothetical protein
MAQITYSELTPYYDAVAAMLNVQKVPGINGPSGRVW